MKYNPEKHRLPVFPHSGILLVDKPPEWTSHDVVNFVRVRFNVPKVGHCGTLDPAATGLLVVVLGHATKISRLLSDSDKTYEGTVLFGIETDSQDMEGEITAGNDCSSLTPEIIEKEFAKFVGEQEQIPPMISAVKKDGKPLYKLARKGKTVQREPKKITIHSLELKKIYLPYADFVVSCSKGTYVRTLCSDVGKNLGCGAILCSLRRTKSGNFKLKDAVNIETMKTWNQDKLYHNLLGF